MPLARLSLGDVERWRTRLRQSGMRGRRRQEHARRAARRAVAGGAVGLGEHGRHQHGEAARDEVAAPLG
jgi:hypothetical protein